MLLNEDEIEKYCFLMKIAISETIDNVFLRAVANFADERGARVGAHNALELKKLGRGRIF